MPSMIENRLRVTDVIQKAKTGETNALHRAFYMLSLEWSSDSPAESASNPKNRRELVSSCV